MYTVRTYSSTNLPFQKCSLIRINFMQINTKPAHHVPIPSREQILLSYHKRPLLATVSTSIDATAWIFWKIFFGQTNRDEFGSEPCVAYTLYTNESLTRCTAIFNFKFMCMISWLQILYFCCAFVIKYSVGLLLFAWGCGNLVRFPRWLNVEHKSMNHGISLRGFEIKCKFVYRISK